MLETTMATTFKPGTNLKGEEAGGNWTFVLPSRELQRTICLGVPSAKTLRTINKISQSVVIICDSSETVKEFQKTFDQKNLPEVQVIIFNKNYAIPLLEKCADLILMVGTWTSRKISRAKLRLADLQRFLTSKGFIYFEFIGQGSQLSRALTGKELDKIDGKSNILWLTPLRDEMQTAIPNNDRDTVDYFLQHKLYSPTIEIPFIDRAERILDQNVFLGHFYRRYGALIGNNRDYKMINPPDYLRLIAKESGIDITKYRWGLSARGRFNSRKVLFFLFDREKRHPKYIVKLIRDSALNLRVANEYRALTKLSRMRFIDQETLPQPAFFGYHGDLAIVGETVVEGISFRKRTSYSAACPYGQAAVDWLIELGEASAQVDQGNSQHAITVLKELLDRFSEVYQPNPEYYSFLVDQIESIVKIDDNLPTVFQHGDPGTWNLLVTKKGKVAFLDWEAAEPKGMPLWDLFYFLRSYAVGSARTHGIRNNLNGFTNQFLEDSPLSFWILDAIQRYCERTNLMKAWVEPLFYTCWMHRALKETTRLTSTELDGGHYWSLLRLCIENRDAPILSKIFSLQ